ncbi:hypothetical protein PT974_01127 [Cladobotryum mycophilum]|uniref:DUF3669 domain-containing protein n=1 Tax=Cladobotryum mycophilum TaxID=491253 RepID=A0ABR0T3Y8_9HYPO
MDQLHAAPCGGLLPPLQPTQQLQIRKQVKVKNASFVAKCICSNIIAFWAHVSRLWQCPPPRFLPRLPPPRAKTALLLSQAELIAQTSSNWIYVTQMGPGRVLKVSRSLDRSYREYKLHMQVESAFKSVQRDLSQNGFDLDLPYIPECHGFCPNVATSPCSETFNCLDGFPKNGSGYFMEYIHPLNQHHAKYLIRRYLTSSAQSRALSSPASKHFLAKVYLGDTKPLSDQWNADMHDRPAYLDHLLAERVEVCYLAASMGATLAILHWLVGIDAKGVEFVLGRDNRGHVQFWLIDFSDSQPFDRTPESATRQLVDAVVHNQPFWPRWINIRGLRELWACFRNAYLEVSDLIIKDDDDEATKVLPHLFMNELEKIRGSGFLLA